MPNDVQVLAYLWACLADGGVYHKDGMALGRLGILRSVNAGCARTNTSGISGRWSGGCGKDHILLSTRLKRPMPETEITDYYEFLEISPQATQETIHRVYRYLAARYHPDSAGTGNLEMFARLTAVYRVLSDPIRRAEYNTQRAMHQVTNKNPMSTSVDFMDQVEGDLNRRLAVLAILYYRRRMYPSTPEVSLSEIERRMGFPRDYLDFTTWYLTKKRYITRADNADFTLTVEGVDFIETQRATVPVLDKLLTSGSQPTECEVRNQLPASEPPAADVPETWDFPVEVLAVEMVSQM
jgi:hypothetical protein